MRARLNCLTFVALATFRLASPSIAIAADPALSSQLGALVKEATGRGADIGLLVTDLQTGETLYEHKADASFNPASVTKVVTTATALKVLGPGHTFKTHVSRAGKLESGVLEGDLVVRGEGDPSITLERIWRIASLVRVAGVTTVEGDLVVDDTFFDSVRQGAGYEEFDEDRAYTAPVGALSATWNTVAVVARPGARAGAPVEIALDPPTSYVRVVNLATTSVATKRRRLAVSIQRGDRGAPPPPEGSAPGARTGDQARTLVITVRGTMPVGHAEKAYYRPIEDPPMFFGTLLREYLAKEGVVVKGAIRKGAVPDALPLFAFESEPLGVIVRDLNKLSNNFTAEQLLKAIGASRFGAPGTSKKGLDAIAEHLLALGFPPDAWTIRNGSGLARDNRLSPRLFVKVLESAHADFQVRGDFVASMGIAGEDGTLAHRMVGLPGEGSVRGKTGTVSGSTCLAGYAQAANGHTLAFAILMNRVEGKTRRAMDVQDRIGSALAAWRGVQTDTVTVSAPVSTPAPSAPVVPLKMEKQNP